MLEEQKNKYGAAEELKYIYREYDKNNFLNHSNSADFVILRNKFLI